MRRLKRRKYVILGTFLCACVHIFRIYTRGFIEDPDVGSFILLSHSFWSGNIFYDQFFDPKLPHVLPVYSLSLLSGSIAGHLVVTLCCICATGWLINLSGKNIWGGVLYVCLVLLSPGGATGHLAIFANFLIACSYYGLTRYRSLNPQSLLRNGALFWLVISAFFAGWSIGLRPNYGFALIPLSLWFIWQQKLHIQRALIWSFCCIVTILGPILGAVQQAKVNTSDLYELFRSWNRFFYSHVGVSDSAEKIVQMYAHPVGPFTLGTLVLFVSLSLFFSTSRASFQKVVPFAFALSFLWFSYLVTHTYNHYILMDLLIVSLLISSVNIRSHSIFLYAVTGVLWSALLLSPSNPHSDSDSLIIKNQREVLSWVINNNEEQVVSPMWLTPHWVQRNEVPTKGIHPEWSIGLLDRFGFKRLSVVKKFGLDVDWNSQCSRWEENASVFIASQWLFDKCRFKNFQEVSQFSGYPLKVWKKRLR